MREVRPRSRLYRKYVDSREPSSISIKGEIIALEIVTHEADI